MIRKAILGAKSGEAKAMLTIIYTLLIEDYHDLIEAVRFLSCTHQQDPSTPC